MSVSANGTTTTLAAATGPAPTSTRTTSTCVVCKHPISSSPDPWDNGWRCTHGCHCVMIGCIPVRPQSPEQQAAA